MVEKNKEKIMTNRKEKVLNYLEKEYKHKNLPFDREKFKGIITTDTEIKAFYDNCVIHIDHNLTYSSIEPYKKLIK